MSTWMQFLLRLFSANNEGYRVRCSHPTAPQRLTLFGEEPTKELIEARKATESIIAAVALDAPVELVGWEMIDQLGEDDAADVHASLSARGRRGAKGGQNRRWKFKSKKPGTPLILMTALRLIADSEPIAGQ